MPALRTVLLVIASLVIGGVTPLRANGIQTFQMFSFVGACLDCDGNGAGNLILMNYVAGDPLTLENFVRFTYSSNLTAFDLIGTGMEDGQIDGLFGSIPALLPAAADFTLTTRGQVLTFQSTSAGSWCSGINGCNLDFGTDGIWSDGLIDLPETGSFTLMAAGLGGLLLLRRVRESMRVTCRAIRS